MKYKLWCKDKNEWEKDSWVILPNGNLMWVEYGNLVRGVYMKNHVLVRSTEFKDIDGKEIYEGDIIRYWDNFDERYKLAIIKFDKGSFIMTNDRINWNIGVTNKDDKVKIVGNIYENKNLIEDIDNC